MSHEAPILLRVVNDCTAAAATAGIIVRKVLKSGSLAIVDKGVNDLQTKADRAAQQYIVETLAKAYPKATIIGEEGELASISENVDEILKSETLPTGIISENVLRKPVSFEHINSIQENELVIWVDPLDGTKEFTAGLLSHVTILVGVAVHGKPVGGVIHQPFFTESEGRTIWGIPGVGYGGFDFTMPPKKEQIAVTTRSHLTPRVEAALNAIKPDQILRVGGAGNKVLYLLEGKANAYVFASRGCKKWDTCAPEAILETVGGKLTDLDGNHYKYHKDVEHGNEEGLLATAPGMTHSWYVDTIRNAS